jgi:hypothetical protein
MVRAEAVTAWLGLAALVGVAAQSGCSDSTAPAVPVSIAGVVTTRDGLPVVNAPILVSYRPSFSDVLPPRQQTSVQPDTIGVPIDSWHITNSCGDTVRTLCDGDCPIGSWNGRADDGRRVVDGVYRQWVVFDDGTSFSSTFFMFSEYSDWTPSEYQEPHARTNGLGRFWLSDQCLGFGETLEFFEDGRYQVRVVTRWIDILAIDADGRRVWADSVLVPEQGVAYVNLVFD